jgi:hypothetical protein
MERNRVTKVFIPLLAECIPLALQIHGVVAVERATPLCIPRSDLAVWVTASINLHRALMGVLPAQVSS